MHLLLFFISILSLSQASSLNKLADAPVEIIGFWRLLGSGIIMLLFAYFFEVRKYRLVTATDSNIQIDQKQSLKWIFLSGFFFFLHLWTYIYAAKNSSISNTVILFALNPLFTAFISTQFLKHQFSKNLWLANLIAFSGVYFLIRNNLNGDIQVFWNSLFALVSGLLYSIYILLGKKARQTFSNFKYTAGAHLTACLCFLIVALTKNLDLFHYSDLTKIAILALIVFPTLLGHSLFSYLLKFLDVNWMSTGKLSEPIFASITASILFNEQWNSNIMIAFTLTSLSLISIIQPWKKRKAQ